MRYAHAVCGVRAAEAALMELVPEGALMGRAAAGLAAVCARLLGSCYGARVVVLAGAGDNGGDALYAGARLRARGAAVTAICVSSRVHKGGTEALRRAGGRIIGVSAAEPVVAGAAGAEAAGAVAAGAVAAGAVAAGAVVAGADLIIDGILGIGGHGGLRGSAAALAGLVERARHAGAKVVAADLPSGCDADTGVVSGAAITADVTVTFGTFKPGLLIDPGASHAGTVELIDIGLRPYLAAPAVAALQAADVAAWLPRLGAESDKYRRGVLGILAGSDRYTGAAVLATGGAIRGGAGMVRLVSAATAADQVRQHWPEAVITVTDPLDPAAAVAAAGRVQAWVAGPGLGTGDDAAAQLATVLATPVPVLIDADGLTVLAARRDLLAGRPAGAVTLITPHAGELSRLIKEDHSEIESHRLESARRAAAELGVTVLLKGSTTVIAAAPGGGAADSGGPSGAAKGRAGEAEPVYVNPTGTPWLATAGSGDVLSGLAGALLAQGLTPAARAGAAAAFLHGLAGRLAADGASCGAADVAAALPDAFRRIAESR